MQWVTHKHTGERMRVKKDTGRVCTCWIEKPYYIGVRTLVDVRVCMKENLIFENKKGQLKLEL